jgi:hypothetical protein
MAIDSIVTEVRQVRETYAKQFTYDVYAMWRDLWPRHHIARAYEPLLPFLWSLRAWTLWCV